MMNPIAAKVVAIVVGVAAAIAVQLEHNGAKALNASCNQVTE
jgi:hypothetical protein